MKILFISSAGQPDYLCDSLYHGLKEKYGNDVESVNDMWYMYTTLLPDEQQYLYGKGFSLYGLLNTQVKNVPSITEIADRIENNYYRYIIYGAVQQCKLFLKEVFDNYPSNKIIFIDGEDRTSVLPQLVSKGFYFKRELVSTQKNLYPISFAIPAKKIVDNIPHKSRDWAVNYPGKLNTYIHKTEESYYADYRTSKFAATFKKEGWDCLRHYEILANGCLPYFKDLKGCPANTLTNFPKDVLLDIKTKIESKTPFSDEAYNRLVNLLLDYARRNLTTEALADYVIKVASDNKLEENNKPIKIPLDDAVQKADFVDQVINKVKSPVPVIIHHGLSSAQELRFLKKNNFMLYVNSMFKSALNDNWPNGVTVRCNSGDDMPVVADVIILDTVLPYQENILDYMQNVIKLMRQDTKLIIAVPNYRSLGTVLGFMKNDLKFGRLTLAKSSQVNFYSKTSLIKFLNSFNLQYKRVLGYSFDETHPIKRMLNKTAFLQYFTCKKILIEAELKHE
jgi:hypothetical protein